MGAPIARFAGACKWGPFITQGDVPRLYRRRVVTTFSAAGDNPPLKYMMHTRMERKMLPYRQPARGAAARSASLEYKRFNIDSILAHHTLFCNSL